MRVSQARIASSNKTGLVYKISFALVLLLGLLVYKLNDYFKNDKTYAMQSQVRKRVVAIKTSVSGQLTQVRNVLSAYQTDMNEANINWVQLDPFFAIAKVEKNGTALKVTQIVSRSNTPAERWNANYLEKAIGINQAKRAQPILIQLFKDRAANKFILVRFQTSPTQEIVLAGMADYFQKYFDIERGSRNKSLLVTSEKVLAAHTEADYISAYTKEAQLSPKQYIIEKEEIVGTNLMAVSYILKNKVAAGFVVPWSIVGVVAGFGCILIGILFYTLDPIERRVERYKMQEREQIYKDTVKQTSLQSAKQTAHQTTPPPQQPVEEPPSRADHSERTQTAWESEKNIHDVSQLENSSDSPFNIDHVLTNVATPVSEIPSEPENSRIEIIDLLERNPATVMPNSLQTSMIPDQFITLDEEKIDLDEIEKALALDDFDQEPVSHQASDIALEKNLKPQKISLSVRGGEVEEPRFVFEKKDFKVDEIKINIRRPERS